MNAHELTAKAELSKRNDEKGKELTYFKRVQTKKTVKLKIKNEEEYEKYIDSAIERGGENTVLKALEHSLARDDYLAWIQLTTPSFIPTRLAMWLSNKVNEWVRAVEQGKHLRILLSMPRQHGKSMVLTERLPSWFIGRNPDKKCLLTAYGADLAEQFGDTNRRIAMQYWKKVFDINLSTSQNNKAHFGVDKHIGYIHSSGIDGAIAGYGGALVIIDDPYKPKEADNPNIREIVSQSFRNTIMPTVDGLGSLVLVIHTRFVENDLIGELSHEAGWEYINIPCVAEINDPIGRKKGEPLLPELGKGIQFVNDMIAVMGKRNFMAQYQGRPFIDNGDIMKRDYFKFYTKNTLPEKFDEVVQSWDLANEKGATNDYTAGHVWGRVGANHYLLKRIKKKMDINEIYATIKAISNAYPLARKKLVERRASGYAVINTLNDIIGGFKGIEPMDSKVQRVRACVPYLESGNVYLPCEELDSTIEQFINECIRFPNGANDDEVDCMTQYLNDTMGSVIGKVDTNKGLLSIRKAFSGVKL